MLENRGRDAAGKWGAIPTTTYHITTSNTLAVVASFNSEVFSQTCQDLLTKINKRFEIVIAGSPRGWSYGSR